MDRTLFDRMTRFGSRPLTRRQFLGLSSATMISVLLAACSTGDEDDGTPTTATAASPTPAGSTPGATASGAASPSGSPSVDRSLAMFLALSSALTGFNGLDDQELAKTYLINLGDEGNSLIDLYTTIGMTGPDVPITFAQIEQAGVFDDDALRALADKITVCWYSGKYQEASGDMAVATYINALGWQATGFRTTGPSTCAGQTGVWATPPA